MPFYNFNILSTPPFSPQCLNQNVQIAFFQHEVWVTGLDLDPVNQIMDDPRLVPVSLKKDHLGLDLDDSLPHKTVEAPQSSQVSLASTHKESQPLSSPRIRPVCRHPPAPCTDFLSNDKNVLY